jgi:hypothetical protein
MVGITLEIDELERGAYMKLLRASDFDLAGISGIGLPTNDPYMHISNFYHSRYGFKVGEEAPSPSLINNPELDQQPGARFSGWRDGGYHRSGAERSDLPPDSGDYR